MIDKGISEALPRGFVSVDDKTPARNQYINVFTDKGRVLKCRFRGTTFNQWDIDFNNHKAFDDEQFLGWMSND